MPSGAAQPIQRGLLLNTSGDLAAARSRLGQELQSNPDLQRKLIASVQAEVGDQGPEAKLAYIESVMNRALARGQTLDATISDKSYYPVATTSKLGRQVSQAEASYVGQFVNSALNGSNLSNFATGNESGNVHSGGAPVTYNPRTGERFVLENADAGWNKGMSPGKAAQPQGLFQGQGFTLTDAKPDELKTALTADQANQDKQRTILTSLPEQQQNLPALINRLQKPVEGVNDAMRQNYLKAIQDEATKVAQEHWGIKDPKEAYDKMMSTPILGAVGEVVGKVVPYFNQAIIAAEQTPQVVDQKRLDDFAKALHPEATPEGRRAFITSITSIKDPTQRSQAIGTLMAQLPETTQSFFNVADLADSADRVGDPEYQRRMNEAIQRQVDANMKAFDAASDPRLKNTGVGFVADQLAQLPKNVTEALTGPIGANLMLSEIYQQTVDRIKHDNPGISDDDARSKATASTAAQFIPAEVLQRLTGGLLGGVTRGIESPLARVTASALVHTGAGAGVGSIQQIATNIAEGKQWNEGLPQAAAAGAVQAAPGAVIGGAHEAAEVPRTEERPAVTEPERPVVTEPAEQPRAAAEPVAPPAEPAAAPAARPAAPAAEAQPQPTQPVTREDVARRAYEISQEREQTGQPGDQLSDWHQAQTELANTQEPLPPTAGDSEPIVSAIANRYTAERMARGELGQIDPSQGTSTEDLVMQGLKMSPQQRESLIDNFVEGKGGDLDQQGAAIRAKEANLSEQSRAASRAAAADPNNPQLQAAAKAANDEVTAFHNGPLKQFKRVWSDSGRVLQQELPLDYTTLNGMKEAYLKKQGKAAPDSLEPALQKIADNVSKAAETESVAMNNLGKAIDNEVQNQTRTGKRLPTDDQVRARLAEIMKDFPCPT